MTYTITDMENVTGTVTDALTGRVTATLRGGSRVVLFEELCTGCDTPIADGPCGCADPVRASQRRAA
jgi:Na+-translocating ferredoxin:NAD+ oxidoreductase RNF subunit RnfB